MKIEGHDAVLSELKTAMGALSQRDYAASIGVSGAYINQILLGQKQMSRNMAKRFGFDIVKVYRKK